MNIVVINKKTMQLSMNIVVINNKNNANFPFQYYCGAFCGGPVCWPPKNYGGDCQQKTMQPPKKQGNLQRNMVVDIKTVQLSISRLPWKSFEDKKENCRLDIELLLLVFTCSSILLVELFCLEHLTSTTTADCCKLP